MIELYEAGEEWEQACAFRQQLLETVIDGEERFRMLTELADVWADRVGDAHQALAAPEQAADLKPDGHPPQHRSLQLYQKSGQWEQVVLTLQRIAEGDPKADRRARYFFTMAQVYRDKLDDPYQAATLFDEALDLNPEYLDAFARLDKIYTQLQDW